jgi:hypothetical protein
MRPWSLTLHLLSLLRAVVVEDKVTLSDNRAAMRPT